MKTKLILMVMCTTVSFSTVAQIQKSIFRIIAIKANGKIITQTGFIYKNPSGTVGILTALHGVINVTNIKAENDYSELYSDLVLSMVDTKYDLAFLTSESLSSQRRGLNIAGAVLSVGSMVKTWGYPLGMTSIYERRTDGADPLSVEQIGSLNNRVGTTTLDLILNRTSPSSTIDILFIVGHIRKGESGSPIFNSQNQVIGMIDGGKEGINWAIPLTGFQLRSKGSQQAILNNIIRNDFNADLYSETMGIVETQEMLESGEKIEMFVDDNYVGDSFKIASDWSATDENDPWYRAISSIKIPDGWSITAYSGINFSGSSMTLTSSWSAPHWSHIWNDKIKSIRINTRR